MSKYIPIGYAIPNPQPTGFRESIKGSFKFEPIYYGIPSDEYGTMQLYPQLPKLSGENIQRDNNKYVAQPEKNIESILKAKPMTIKVAVKAPIKYEEQVKKERVIVSDTEYIMHDVKSIDTLDGISIMYGISKERIRMENQFLGEEIYMFKKLKIPKTTQPKLERVDKYDEEAIAKRKYIHHIASMRQ